MHGYSTPIQLLDRNSQINLKSFPIPLFGSTTLQMATLTHRTTTGRHSETGQDAPDAGRQRSCAPSRSRCAGGAVATTPHFYGKVAPACQNRRGLARGFLQELQWHTQMQGLAIIGTFPSATIQNWTEQTSFRRGLPVVSNRASSVAPIKVLKCPQAHPTYRATLQRTCTSTSNTAKGVEQQISGKEIVNLSGLNTQPSLKL
jgi:hypothetical protein